MKKGTLVRYAEPSATTHMVGTIARIIGAQGRGGGRHAVVQWENGAWSRVRLDLLVIVPKEGREMNNPAAAHLQHRLAAARTERIQQVRRALITGERVDYSLRTLMEDGHSVEVIKAVTRPVVERGLRYREPHVTVRT